MRLSGSSSNRNRLIGLVMAFGVLLLLGNGSLRAAGSWTQTDWSGGSGTSTSNQYSSSSNLDTTTNGQFSLSKSAEVFSNTSFNSNITGWNGVNQTYDTGTKYSGAGAAKITAAASSSSPFNAATNTALSTSDARNITTADLNSDGLKDVVIAGGSSCKIYVYLSNGTGGWQTASEYTTLCNTAFMVKAGDVNNDNQPDIVLSYNDSVSFSVFINSSNASSFTRNDYTGPQSIRPCSVALGRFNNDTYVDLVFVCYINTNFNVYINNGSGGFPTKTTYNGGTGTTTPVDIVTLDYNGDGYTDIAQPSTSGGCKWRLLLNSGGSSFATYNEYAVSPCGTSNNIGYAFAAGNLNNDSYDDIAIAYRSGTGATGGDTYYVATSLGSASGVPSTYATYSAVSGIYSSEADMVMGDVSGDGYADLLVLAPGTTQYSYYANNGNGTLATKQDFSTGSGPVDITAGDFSGDGKIDVAYVNKTAQTLTTAINKTGGDALTQNINLGSTDTYVLQAYVYTTGAAVTSADAALYANGQSLSTTYTATATAGWYELKASLTAANSLRNYGIQAATGKTIYVDDMSLFKYASSGTLTSAVYDLGYGGDWGALTYNTSGSGTTTVKVRSSNNSDMSGATDFSSCSSISSGTDLTGQSCMTDNRRYVQYQITLTPSSDNTPTFQDITINYEPWDLDPPNINAANITMQRSGGAVVAADSWINENPVFSWDEATDAPGGTGIMGYCLYLGHDQATNPQTSKGLLGGSPLDTNGACQFAISTTDIDLAAGYLATSLSSSNDAYYLSIKAIDNANNVYAGAAEEFSFYYDDTPPTNPSYVSAPSQFIATKDVSLTWPTSGGDAAADANSGVVGLQYRIGSSGTWYGDDHLGTQDTEDLLDNDGEYSTIDPEDYDAINEGNNTVYFRTWDQAGNVSTNAVTTVIKLNTTSPSGPQSVTATPSTNTTNSFAFSWNPPASYSGLASSLQYCYTVNTLPTINTCTMTAAGVTSLAAGAYATQPGENTFYVVAKDEAGNINYATASSVAFTANTSAPGIPLDLDVADISIKATSNWRLALSWNEPTDTGAGVASYKVYRSTNNSTFTQVASTSGTSYVDGSLNEQEYYYKVMACDSANNCGAFSSVVHKKPTGKFTTPAEITSQPRVTDVSTRKATISWSTNRGSDSRLQYGTISGQYFATEAAISQQVTDHEVALNNLTAGTTYYIKAKWTDEDGNTGQTSEFTFRTSPAPVVKEVTAGTTLTTADISFTSKDAATVKVYYGKSDTFGGLKALNTSLSESRYTVTLDGLDDGSKYFYKLNTLDEDGNEYEGNVYSFTTPPRPQISNLRFQPVEDQPSSTQKVSWTTNVAATSELNYGIGATSQTVLDNKLDTNHEVVISGLLDNSTYVLVARSRDANGNVAISAQQVFKTDLDTRPPKISNVVVDASVRGTGADARGQVVVSWKTDEPSTSQVAFGEGSSGAVNNSTSEDAKLTTDHVVVVSDLSTSRVYHFEPRSYDQAHNEAKGEQKVAIIGRASENVLSIIFNALQQIFGIK